MVIVGVLITTVSAMKSVFLTGIAAPMFVLIVHHGFQSIAVNVPQELAAMAAILRRQVLSAATLTGMAVILPARRKEIFTNAPAVQLPVRLLTREMIMLTVAT